MGSVNSQRRSQVRFSLNSPTDGYKTNCGQSPDFTYYDKRGKRLIRKGFNRDSTSIRDTSRFLQYAFSCSKKDEKFETSNQFKTSQPVYEEAALHNGYTIESIEFSVPSRLGFISRPERCLSSCTNPHVPQKISSFLHTRETVLICSSLFRSFSSPKSFYKNSDGNCSSFENAKYSSSVLSGRLATSKSSKRGSNFRSRENAPSSDKTRVYYQSRKICTETNTGDYIHRGTFQVQTRNSYPNSRQNCQIGISSSKYNERSKHCERLSGSFGFDSILYRTHPECTSIYETHSVTFTTFLETLFCRFKMSDFIYTTPKQLDRANTSRGRSLHQWSATVTINTDA